MSSKPPIERYTAPQESCKHEDLDDQATNNDVISNVHEIGIDKQPRPVPLDGKTQEVARDEEDRCLARSHWRKGFTLGGAHDAGIDHVEGRGKEDGWEDKKDGLQNVEDEGARCVVSGCAGYVADFFDCGGCRC